MRALVLLAALFVASCFDPGHSDAVDALGPEARGVSPGPLHRPGQPCVLCHGGAGPGSPDFSVGGTVFVVRGGTEPASGATVTLRDARGETRTLLTNTAGNFFVRTSEWSPQYPVHATVTRDNDKQEMLSRIGGDGSCATCHRSGGDNAHVPAIYLRVQ